MRLLILGATGKTGNIVVEQALTAGHQVTALVRSPAKLTLKHDRLTVRVGDVKRPIDVAAALVGHHAVISTLGTNDPRTKLMTPATIALIAAMRQTRVKRVVMLSSFLASPRLSSNLLVGAVRKILSGVIADKNEAEQLLASSRFNYTIMYAARLKKGGPTGKYRLGDFGLKLSDSIARADVAAALLKTVGDAKFARRSVTVAN